MEKYIILSLIAFIILDLIVQIIQSKAAKESYKKAIDSVEHRLELERREKRNEINRLKADIATLINYDGRYLSKEKEYVEMHWREKLNREKAVRETTMEMLKKKCSCYDN